MEKSAGFGNGRAEAFAAAKQEVVELAQFEALGAFNAGATEANGVEAGDGIVMMGQAERRQVFADARAALHKGQSADPNELVQEAIRGDKDPIADSNVAREEGAVGNDDMITHNGVVADM